MELLAVIEALAENSGVVEIRSDSTYVVNCFRDRWWAGWRARGWRNSQGKPVANQDLWSRLIGEVVDRRPNEIGFTWVKGHSNDAMNNVVDEFATRAARLQRPSRSVS
jgi:ribonuclease HI